MTNSATSFFFYDLETSGLNPHKDRIMQFAGQRTDMDLMPIGEPIDLLVSLTDDVLPEPGALLVTGITPQKTRDEGYTEAQMLAIVAEQVLTPGTIIVGYNNVKFDDDFMRCTLYRNMYDAYEWQTRDGRSRWDLLDVVRITRALRPEGIEWPFDDNGVPSNRLEQITQSNGLEHVHAHDALSDVTALIAVAQLIKTKQPKLYDFLLNHRDKKTVAPVVETLFKPFIFTNYTYPKQYIHTSIATTIAPGTYGGSFFVYDLRHDPTKWTAMPGDALQAHCQITYDQRADGHEFLPVRQLKTNACPAVAPYEVLRADAAAQKRLELNPEIIRRHLSVLRANPEFGDRVAKALEREFETDSDAECQLYDGFVPDSDKSKMVAVRTKSASQLRGFDPNFSDKRLQAMLVRYKARNHPSSLSEAERAEWETYRTQKLRNAWPHFVEALQKAATDHSGTDAQFMLEELQLYGQSMMPSDD